MWYFVPVYYFVQPICRIHIPQMLTGQIYRGPYHRLVSVKALSYIQADLFKDKAVKIHDVVIAFKYGYEAGSCSIIFLAARR